MSAHVQRRSATPASIAGAQLDPGVVVEHQHLDGVFAWVAAQQQCDAIRLANPKISRREKQRIRAGSAARIPAASLG